MTRTEQPAAHEGERPALSARLVDWLITYRRIVLSVAVVVALVAAYRTALTYRALRSDLEELLPETAPSVVALATLRERIPGLRHLGVVVDIVDPKNEPAARRFLDDLKARIQNYPPQLVRAVRTGIGEERRFGETYALQLMKPGDVRKLRKAVEERRDWEVTREMDLGLLDEEEDPPPKIPLHELERKYEKRYGRPRKFPDDRFIADDKKTAVLIVQAASHETGYDSDSGLLRRVQADVKRLGFPDAYAKGMRLGYAGDIATRVEEMDGLRADLTLSGALVLLLVVSVIVWFFRSAAALPILIVPLLCGTFFAFALVALPPLRIQHLNSNTAFLGSIVVGNGINTGIILLGRFQEQRKQGHPLREALAVALSTTWRPTLAAALAASSAYGSLVFTDFRGFNQFGFIGGLGMLVCWATTIMLVPPLVSVLGQRMSVLDPKKPRARPSLAPRVIEAWLLRPRRVLAGALVLSIAAGVALVTRSSDWIEHDFSKLRRRDSWIDGERYWGPRMDATLHRYLTPTVVLADNADQAKSIEDRLRKLKASHRAGGLIASVRSAADVLPEHRQESVREIAKLRQALTPRMLSEVAPKDRRAIERATSKQALVPVRREQIPDALAAGLREYDGRIERSVLVFPKLTHGTWNAGRMRAFTDDLRNAATLNGHTLPVAGSLLLSSDIATAMRADGPRASALALSAVLLICLLAFGRVRAGPGRPGPWGAMSLSALAVGSVFVGVLLMAGGLAATGARLNFSNFVALPITFGIGADYSINMLRRYQSEGGVLRKRSLGATGGAVALCSATTIIGFGSLLVAQNRALFSFGLFAVAGEIACLFTAVVVLPALLGTLSLRNIRPAEPAGV